MVGRVDPRKQALGMFQQVAKYNKNMFVVLLEMSRLNLVNQHVVKERMQVQNSLKQVKVVIQKPKQEVQNMDKYVICMHRYILSFKGKPTMKNTCKN
jgi:UTP-glucose-1-phosphate uridylyltransferase